MKVGCFSSEARMVGSTLWKLRQMYRQRQARQQPLDSILAGSRPIFLQRINPSRDLFPACWQLVPTRTLDPYT